MPHRVPRGWAPWRMRSKRTVLTDSEARQGPRGRPVLAVLVGSGALLGLYLVGMMVWTIIDRSTDTGAPERVATAPATAPSSALSANDPPAANPAYPVPAVPAVK